MTNLTVEKPSLGSLKTLRRKPVALAGENLINVGRVVEDSSMPILVEPAVEALDLLTWLQNNQQLVLNKVGAAGGVLFRGFQVASIADFEACVALFADELLDYTYRSTPRSEVAGKILSSTEYPAGQHIPMHNEMSYSRSWPAKIWFHCVTAADDQGETPLTDSHRVFERISPATRELFMEKGVAYIRNYGEGVDLPWQDVFQTEDRSQVETFCNRAGIEFEWLDAGRLRTRQEAQVVAKHPANGKMLWFNQAHLFHVSSLDPMIREFMIGEFTEAGLPRNATFADGSTIPDELLDEIREAYRQEMVVFPWQEGDVLFLDNMQVAHGRRPFKGQRKVVVGMADAVTEAGV